MRLLSILLLLSLSSPVYAYPEYPPFAQTQFHDDYGMFRWWESCWWRVVDPYVYLLCGNDGQIQIVYPDGAVGPASETDLNRLFSFDGGSRFSPPPAPRRYIRFSEGRLTPAPGDGYSLSEVYGGRFWRFDGRGSTYSGSSYDFSFGGDYSSLGTGVHRFDGTGREYGGSGFPFGGDNGGTQRIFGQDVPTSSDGGGTGIFDRDGNRFEGTRMNDVFYEPLNLFNCDSIYDSIDGGIFGPIPCTSYPGVFGPKVEYGRAN